MIQLLNLLLIAVLLPLVSDFNYDSQTIPAGSTLGITNLAYSPNGLSLNRYVWKLEKSVGSGWSQVGSDYIPHDHDGDGKADH